MITHPLHRFVRGLCGAAFVGALALFSGCTVPPAGDAGTASTPARTGGPAPATGRPATTTTAAGTAPAPAASAEVSQEARIKMVMDLQKQGILTEAQAMELTRAIISGQPVQLPSASGPTRVAAGSTPASGAGSVPPATAAAVIPAVDAGILLPSYRPLRTVTGRLRSIGSDTMDNLVARWEQEFARFHPGLSFRHEGLGSSTAIPALLEGRSDLGPMSRAVTEAEIGKFKESLGYEPTVVRVAIDGLAVFVHPSNPVAEKGLSLQQLDGIFSASRNQGGEEITRWGQLGLGGEWMNRPITVYSRNTASGTYKFFQDNVLKKGEFRPTAIQMAGSEDLVRAIAADPGAIGYSGIGFATSAVRVVPVARVPNSAAIPPLGPAVLNGTYPLARALFIAVNRNPAAAVAAEQQEFFRFVFSREGQTIVQGEGFFPLPETTAAEELARVVTGVGATPPVAVAATPAVATSVTSAGPARDPRYAPSTVLTGRLRSVGSDTMDGIMAEWEKLFRVYHPELRVAHEGRGSSTAVPALLEDRSDLGPMSRPLSEAEIAKFREVRGYPPQQVRVAIDALGIYVHPSNPVARTGLTLAQLDAIFSKTRSAGAPEDIVRWGQLGLAGEWANAPITVYSRNSASGTYAFFRETVLRKGDFKDSIVALPGSAQVVEAVGRDRYGIGYSGIGYKTDAVVLVPVLDARGEAVAATEQNALREVYPLARGLYLIIGRQPGVPPSDTIREFLSFALGPVGQQVVAGQGFFAIPGDLAREELKKALQ